ncbi:toll/interleukin-1 receptor domain-containing protein [Marinicella sp. W31]|uniref:toll/interleukin-1 receptor domain-containing protein n=1 Tax=Marinicella sp. W31 TaxID=3023713 RepID=UPI003757C0FF
MSVPIRQNEVIRHQRMLADLQRKMAEESRKETSKNDEINRINRSITNSTSIAILRSKEQQISRAMSQIASIQKKKADLQKKMSDVNVSLHRAQEALMKEEEKLRNKVHDSEKRREREQLIHQRAITQELRTQHSFKVSKTFRKVSYDVFISHASEDKEDFVKPLVEALSNSGYKVWYDEFTLKVGDSLRRSIDNGLKDSKYGIVVLSKAFFEKNWTQYELDGLVTKEMEGNKVILPIWHMVSKDQVQNYSLTLADKKAINSSISNIDEIVKQLAEVLDE